MQLSIARFLMANLSREKHAEAADSDDLALPGEALEEDEQLRLEITLIVKCGTGTFPNITPWLGIVDAAFSIPGVAVIL